MSEWLLGEVVAELFGKHAAYVTVTRGLETDGRRVFVIAGRARGTRPYRAAIPACPCDLVWCSRQCKRHSARQSRPSLPSRGAPGAMKPEAVADVLGITVDEYRARLELARGGAA